MHARTLIRDKKIDSFVVRFWPAFTRAICSRHFEFDRHFEFGRHLAPALANDPGDDVGPRYIFTT